jgi:hypothetical protein
MYLVGLIYLNYITLFGLYMLYCQPITTWSGVGVIDTGAKLRGRQSGFRIPAGTRNYFSFRNVHTGAETQPASCSVGIYFLSRA